MIKFLVDQLKSSWESRVRRSAEKNIIRNDYGESFKIRPYCALDEQKISRLHNRIKSYKFRTYYYIALLILATLPLCFHLPVNMTVIVPVYLVASAFILFDCLRNLWDLAVFGKVLKIQKDNNHLQLTNVGVNNPAILIDVLMERDMELAEPEKLFGDKHAEVTKKMRNLEVAIAEILICKYPTTLEEYIEQKQLHLIKFLKIIHFVCALKTYISDKVDFPNQLDQSIITAMKKFKAFQGQDLPIEVISSLARDNYISDVHRVFTEDKEEQSSNPHLSVGTEQPRTDIATKKIFETFFTEQSLGRVG